MSKQDQMQPDRVNEVSGQSFSEMNIVEKIKYLGKVIVFLATGGFAFPNIFTD